MNIKPLDQQLIINEWQLGQQLNNAVHNGARGRFNLLLSFLSDDARDFSQFEVHDEPKSSAEVTDLREHFELSLAQPLVNEGPSINLLIELNEDLQQRKLTTIRLKQLLTNEALLSKQATTPIEGDILDNLSLLKQRRMHEAYQSTSRLQYTTGVDAKLLDEYQPFNAKNKPVKLQYV